MCVCVSKTDLCTGVQGAEEELQRLFLVVGSGCEGNGSIQLSWSREGEEAK